MSSSRDDIGALPRVILNDKGATGAPLQTVAERTGLEPATPGVTGRYSNRLNYHSSSDNPAYSTCTELVGAERLELPTYAL